MDFRDTTTGRKQSWYGMKRHVKRALASRPANLALRAIVRLRPDLRWSGRLPAPAYLTEVRG